MCFIFTITSLPNAHTQGEWVEDADQVIKLKVDVIISAFGSELEAGEVTEAMAPITFNKWGNPVVDSETMATTVDGVFCGGDVAGVANVSTRFFLDINQPMAL